MSSDILKLTVNASPRGGGGTGEMKGRFRERQREEVKIMYEVKGTCVDGLSNKKRPKDTDKLLVL